MSKEIFTNGAVGFLSADATSGATTITLISSALFPTTGQFRVKVDSEIMLGTANNTGTGVLTVTRAQEGTAAAAHLAGSIAFSPITSASLSLLGRQKVDGTDVGARREINFISGTNVTITGADDSGNDRLNLTIASTGGGGGGGSSISRGAIGSIPAAGTAGTLYLPTDASAILEDTGSAWKAYGPINPFDTPADWTAFTTWTNQGTASVASDKTALVMTAPTGNSDNLRCYGMNIHAAPYTYVAAFRPHQLAQDFQSMGLFLRESSSGKIITFHVGFSTNNLIAVNNWNSATSFNATPKSWKINQPPFVWMKVVDDSTNRAYYWSVDGRNWMLIYSASRTTFGTPDQIGIFIDPNDNSNSLASNLYMTLFHWVQS